MVTSVPNNTTFTYSASALALTIAGATESASGLGTTVSLIVDSAVSDIVFGESIQVAGVSVAGYNGTWVVTGVSVSEDQTTITYTASVSGLALVLPEGRLLRLAAAAPLH